MVLNFFVLFHLSWYSQGPSMFLQMAVLKCFLWLSSIETSNEAGNPNVLKISPLEYQIFTKPGYSFSSRSSAPPLGSVNNQGREKRKNWLTVCHPLPTENTSAMSNLRPLWVESTPTILFLARHRKSSAGPKRERLNLKFSLHQMCVNDKLPFMGLPKDTDVNAIENNYWQSDKKQIQV